MHTLRLPSRRALMRALPLAAFVVAGTATLGTGCAQLRYAGTEIGQAVDNPVTQQYSWGEVYCGRGTVCAEVEVRRVDIEQRDGGEVAVFFHNRTGDSLAVQVSLEVLDQNGAKVDGTNFEDMGLAPRQEREFRMPGIARPGHKVRVLIRQRNAG